MNGLTAYFNSLRVDEFRDDELVKIANTRNMLASLPASQFSFDKTTIPDIDFKVRFPKTAKTPSAIVDFTHDNKGEHLLAESSTLLGLCLNGRELPLEIFINHHAISKFDPSGNLFDEIIWHEYLHGAEDINSDGLTRDLPWSYELQEKMLQLDDGNDSDFISGLNVGDDLKQFMHDVREGTSAQQNVSEIFARVGVLYLKQIRETGVAPTSSEAVNFLSPEKLSRSFNDASNLPMTELAFGLRSYSEPANNLFWESLPEMIGRLSRLYGRPEPGF